MSFIKLDDDQPIMSGSSDHTITQFCTPLQRIPNHAVVCLACRGRVTQALEVDTPAPSETRRLLLA